VWLQHLPSDQIPACGPGLQYWLENMPLSQTIQLLFKGDGNCAEVQWVFLGLSMGEWSLVCFAGLLLVGIFLFLKKLRRETVITN
jgi:disulfide bond formation protein DsbB